LIPLYLQSITCDLYGTDYVLENDGFRLLSNGKQFPLVGLGLGCLNSDVNSIVQASLDLGFPLLYVATDVDLKAISNTQKSFNIIFKVSYNPELKKTIESLLDMFRNDDIRIHLMLSLPERDEEIVDDNVNDWFLNEGWRALEDMYTSHQQNIESIGVSNFNAQELNDLISSCRIKPHVAQTSLSNLDDISSILLEHNIASQVYGVFPVLRDVASDHSYDARMNLRKVAALMTHDKVIHPATVLSSHFVQKGISFLSCTSDTNHLRENSPLEVLPLKFNSMQKEKMENVVNSLLNELNGESEEEPIEEIKEEPNKSVSVNFQNNLDLAVDVFWVQQPNRKLVLIIQNVEPGDTQGLNSFHGHEFVVKDSNGVVGEFSVTEGPGETQTIVLE